jgi:hypothetical protein
VYILALDEGDIALLKTYVSSVHLINHKMQELTYIQVIFLSITYSLSCYTFIVRMFTHRNLLVLMLLFKPKVIVTQFVGFEAALSETAHLLEVFLSSHKITY